MVKYKAWLDRELDLLCCKLSVDKLVSYLITLVIISTFAAGVGITTSVRFLYHLAHHSIFVKSSALTKSNADRFCSATRL
jgi:hypothetical protein